MSILDYLIQHILNRYFEIVTGANSKTDPTKVRTCTTKIFSDVAFGIEGKFYSDISYNILDGVLSSR